MGVVGPGPDAVSHAEHYPNNVIGCWERHRVKPGITALAQVEHGCAEDEDTTAVKAKYDNIYVQRSYGCLDLYIMARTFWVMIRGIGAR